MNIIKHIKYYYEITNENKLDTAKLLKYLDNLDIDPVTKTLMEDWIFLTNLESVKLKESLDNWHEITINQEIKVSPYTIYTILKIFNDAHPEKLLSSAALANLSLKLEFDKSQKALDSLIKIANKNRKISACIEKFKNNNKIIKNRESEVSVPFSSVKTMLMNYLQVFLDNPKVVSVREDKNISGFTAYTDGKTISLPASVSVLPSQSLNRWAYALLLGHECYHVREGSFSLNLSSLQGKDLLPHIAFGKKLFLKRFSAWHKYYYPEKPEKQLNDNDSTTDNKTGPTLPHLKIVIFHFSNIDLIFHLFNVAEDRRINKLLGEDFQLIGRIDHALTKYSLSDLPNQDLYSPRETFLRAVTLLILGYPQIYNIHPYFGKVFDEITELLFNSLPLKDVESAMLLAIKTYQIISKHPAVFENVSEFFETMRLKSNGLGGLKIPGLNPDHRKGSYFPDWEGNAFPYNFERSARTEFLDEITSSTSSGIYTEPSEGAFFVNYPKSSVEMNDHKSVNWCRYEEYDVWEKTPIQNAVEVREIPVPSSIKSNSIELVTGLTYPFSPLTYLSGPLEKRRFVEEGEEADMDRTYDFSMDLRRGITPNFRLFQDITSHSGKTIVSMIIDATISTYFPRQQVLETITPLVLSKIFCKSTMYTLNNCGFETSLHTLFDLGPRTIYMPRLKNFGELINWNQFDLLLGTLNPLMPAGFRYGAGIRHLASIAQKTMKKRPHIIVIITDNGSHYWARHIDYAIRSVLFEAFKTEQPNCSSCHEKRKECTIERCTPGLKFSNPSASNVYYPPFYEFADAIHAAESTGTIPFMVFTDDLYPETILNSKFGREKWATLLSKSDIPKVINKLSNLIRAV
ncbi:hypothetical protein KKF34_19310 [Myxococcota bacterium]|nr:hypothetical protein [Myxococcota bacterium]MBU1381842.1 hypothetical protein [Myxococcota bacterium]MBU1499037.1 hypothetical protein [Myxococcota bacterium]